MVLARNLKPNRIPKIKSKNSGKRDLKKTALYLIFFVIIIFSGYGILNLFRLAPKEEDKKELVLDTGDRPLPEEIKIWIDSPGGLNMRSEPNLESEVLKIIPNGTELVALELSGDWYKIEYDGKNGWVHKDYVKNFKDQERDIAVNEPWKKYQNTAFSYLVSYPTDWVVRDYGSNEAANLLSYVAFGLQLSNSLDTQNLPPVVIKVTTDNKDTVDGIYKKKTDSKSEQVKISDLSANKYIFTASSGVQMTAYVFTAKSRTFIMEESGGYGDELFRMVSKISF